jgi:iron complex transport system ATP-binding protein
MHTSALSARAGVAPDTGLPVAELAGLRVAAPDGTEVVRGVDLVVSPGEHWALLGPNGAGKTTLLRAVAGTLRPSAGRVRVLGEPHGAAGWRDPRMRIGVIEGQPRAFARGLTALEVVVLRAAGPPAVLGSAIPDGDYTRAQELLELFGCGALAGRRYAACSLGERQRILLARALMRDPALLLLDEPITGLDLPGRAALLRAMRRLAAERPELATLTVTHHVEELAPSTTDALLLRDGRAVACGPIAETLTDAALTRCFGLPVRLTRVGHGWAAAVG